MKFFIHTIWYWFIVFTFVPLHFFVGLFCIFLPDPKTKHRTLARLFIKFISFNMGLKIKVIGIEHIPKNSPCIVMCNHTSLIDILVMVMAVPFRLNFIAKRELIWVPFIGLDMLFEGDFLINRQNAKEAKRCLDKVEQRLNENGKVLIFPEGTRSKTGKLLPFKRGAFKLSVASEAKIVPCYIEGSSKIVRKGSLLARPGTVTVTFSPAIDPPKSKKRVDLDNTLNETFDCINSFY